MDKATFLPRRAQAREEGASHVTVICIKYRGRSHLAQLLDITNPSAVLP